ncbi:hypothetical protein EMIHUDRAFT_224435 [Emiliania huxleyi CCMP1516]|uniref:Uncharacterized protein n=2 Tax=Emiliania huxleyi TaxID=2903 RepID=A0A0D3KSA6_EMIH1|nr:hypothetical protein EMIHUDRAFT_238183 [Emiliania huxleyi CCMP1516]XP_005791070.1 hypothetical protein EMIHUDRAFT_224435 [Emiliania huxleyi CCMP1516]EOD24895.1 hypothetical protein EMIHUDRAFT_238183 [Emiliania huxleyi CCMP1516]EOD38641.1 hypothetical protein EMIHUDRAFT_224435 [Emiliania huxleyi CCMP1516]|eukprot:XP_005777324.1 hypothetical protein EMIHUDRAFT_238183 [Emiliania huxleyi CCMP1516]
MAKVCVISLGSESAPHIAECVRQELGDRSASEEWETSKAPVLVVVVECESDGEPCPAARQFVRALRRSENFANYSQSIGRRAAVLGLASSVCANSAAQLGDGDKYTGASRVERALIAGGCTALLKMGTMEADQLDAAPLTAAPLRPPTQVELQSPEESAIPWARAVCAAL